MKQRASKYFANMKGCDMFGHPISVNYKGSDSYPTFVGTFVSIVIMVLMAINFLTLTSEFMTGRKQDEKTSFEQFNRYTSDKYYFQTNDFEIAAFIWNDVEFVDPSIVQLRAYQKHPCDVEVNEDECPEEEYMGSFGECSEEKKRQIVEFQTLAYGRKKAIEYS